jgi:hypothetical protein
MCRCFVCIHKWGFIKSRYLESVFKLVYETSEETKTATAGVSPRLLAEATTNQAFLDADLNHDGRLSFAVPQGLLSLSRDSSSFYIPPSPLPRHLATTIGRNSGAGTHSVARRVPGKSMLGTSQRRSTRSAG